jgi:two-component system response regulator YesN
MKLLIVDDEPLVQVGLQSMLNWKDLNIEICGTAKNGQEAYEMIQNLNPDIVITDIKMPIMSGLDLLKRCREEKRDMPVFIMLTSYEDFQYARKALQYQAVDYLIKLELNEEILTSTVKKAISVIEKKPTNGSNSNPDVQLSVLQNRFYIRLLNNLFDSDMSFQQLLKDLHLQFHSDYYVAAHLKIETDSANLSCDLTLYNNTINMFENLISKYMECTVVALDLRYFAAVFSLDSAKAKDPNYIIDALKTVSESLHNYYNVSIYCGIGEYVTRPEDISNSYSDAKRIAMYLSSDNSILSINNIDQFKSNHQNIFNLSLFKKEIVKAFENYDTEALTNINNSLYELFSADTIHYTQAVDVAGSILHFAISLIPDGHDLVTTIFNNEPEGYLCLYQCKNVSQVLSFMRKLTDGLTTHFQSCQNNYKNHLVIEVKEYIDAHICEKLSLQEVARYFNISSNYLSQLFKQHLKIGFNEYITHSKIEYAKTLLRKDDVKIYEIAEKLGFENAFYFSKVFKKVSGISPKEYVMKKIE